MKEDTMDRRGRSHPPQCTTSREDRQIVRMVVTDRSVTSRTVAQHIESVTHHSVSARTSRRRLQQSGLSARRPLLGLPLTQNHRRFRHQWCDERRMWAIEWNEVVFTDESRICLQHHDGRVQVWRHREERMLNSATLVLHRVLWYGAVLDITLALLYYALPVASSVYWFSSGFRFVKNNGFWTGPRRLKTQDGFFQTVSKEMDGLDIPS
ncbi:transposable element Tcb1 transposase [Trichonephila clavipes]|nr:transposable element Tcb1 transposase [Trichonephila clavipes]